MDTHDILDRARRVLEQREQRDWDHARWRAQREAEGAFDDVPVVRRDATPPRQPRQQQPTNGMVTAAWQDYIEARIADRANSLIEIIASECGLNEKALRTELTSKFRDEVTALRAQIVSLAEHVCRVDRELRSRDG